MKYLFISLYKVVEIHMRLLLIYKYNERICSAYYVTKCRKSIVMIVGVKKGKSEQKKFEFYIVEKVNKSNDL